jgi:hypothetical protein
MLYTNLKHIETLADYKRVISENDNVMILCCSMKPRCIELYRLAEEFEKKYRHVMFYDLECENPESKMVRNLTELTDFENQSFIIYYKNGKVIETSSIEQTKKQIESNLDKYYK